METNSYMIQRWETYLIQRCANCMPGSRWRRSSMCWFQHHLILGFWCVQSWSNRDTSTSAHDHLTFYPMSTINNRHTGKTCESKCFVEVVMPCSGLGCPFMWQHVYSINIFSHCWMKHTRITRFACNCQPRSVFLSSTFSILDFQEHVFRKVRQMHLSKVALEHVCVLGDLNKDMFLEVHNGKCS